MRWSVVEILSVGIAAVVIGGCVNQKAEVAQYRKVLDGADAKVMPVSAATKPGVLPLEEALRIANADNEQLAISGEDYVQALISKTRAAETFLPSISFAPTMTRQEQFKYPNFGGTAGGGGEARMASPIFTRRITAIFRSTHSSKRRWCAISMMSRARQKPSNSARHSCWICSPPC